MATYTQQSPRQEPARRSLRWPTAVAAGRIPWTVVVVGLVLVVLIVLPMVVLIIVSFVKDASPGTFLGHFSLGNYRQIFTSGRDAVKDSLIIGAGGTAFSVVVGVGLAWLETKTDVPLAGLIRVCGVVPLFFSGLVGAFAWSLLASPSEGYVNLAFKALGWHLTVNVYSLPGIIFVFGLYYSPYVYLLVRGALLLVNTEMEEAAEVLGARRSTVARTITLRLVSGSILGAAILVLALILENFPIPQILGTPSGIQPVAIVIYERTIKFPSSPSVAAAYGVVLLVVLAGMLTLQNRILRSGGRATVTGKGFKPRRSRLGVLRWPALLAAVLYVVLAAVLPLVALLAGAFHPNQYIGTLGELFQRGQWSASPIRGVLRNGDFHRAFLNSLAICAAVAVLGGLISFIVAYLVHRTNHRGARLLGHVAMWPIALPGLVVGLGFLWVWIRVPFIYGTYTILILGYACIFMPQAYQGMTATIVQVHRELEESSQILGAGRIRTVIRVLLPLIRPGFGATLMLLFILSMRELSVAIFLFAPQTQPLSIDIYNTWGEGDFPSVASMSVIYIATLFVLVVLGRKYIGLGSGSIGR